MGRFDEITLDDFERLMGINFWGTVRMCKASLPVLGRERIAHIVNISSIYGIVAAVGQAACSASKFAVRGFSESLRHALAGTWIGVSVVHPGGIATTTAASALVARSIGPQERANRVEAFDRMVRTSPVAAAERILKEIERGEKRILVGPDTMQIEPNARLLPVSYWGLLERAAARTYRAGSTRC